MDLLLDQATGDISIPVSGDVRLTSGVLETTRQRLTIKLRTFLGEWFLDQRIGIPYYRDILVKNPNLSVIQSIFRRAVESDESVETVPRMELALGDNRSLSVSFDAYLIPDNSTAITESGPILLTVGTTQDPFILFF